MRSHLSPLLVLIILDLLKLSKEDPVLRDMAVSSQSLTTRAVHIAIAHSLDPYSMINALRRFISVRGYPEQIRSDQGSNFTKADRELKEAIEEWNQHKINNFGRQKKIEWIFNPPSASHMGGAWERMIRSVRQNVNATLKEQLVSG